MSTETIDIVVKQTGAEQASQAIKQVGTQAQQTGQQVGVLNSAIDQLKAAIVALGLSLGVSKWLELADTFTGMINKLKTVSSTSAELQKTQLDLFNVAQRTRQSLEGMTGIYVSLSKVLERFGFDSERVKGITETLGMSMTISGKNAEDVSQALRRLTLSMHEGEVGGRGLLQFMMQFPGLARAVEANLGIAAGSLRKFAEDGQLTTQRFLQAVEASAPKIAATFAKMDVTISSAFTVLRNSVLQYVGVQNQATGTTQLIAQAILFLAQNISTVMPLVSAFGAALTVFGIAAGGASLALFTLTRPFALLAGLITGAIILIMQLGKTWEVQTGSMISATGVILGSIRTLVNWFNSLKQALVEQVGPAKAAEIAFIGFAAVLALIMRQQIFTFLTQLVGALMAVGKALIFVATNPTSLLIAALLAIIAAVAYFTGSLDGLIEKLQGAMNTAMETLKKNMQDTSREALVAGKEIKGLGNAVSETAQVVNGGTQSMARGWEELLPKPRAYANEVMNAANMTRNAMGEMVQVTDEWARRSGAAFNSVKQEASDMARSVSSSFSQANSAASSFRGGGGGGGGGTQSFTQTNGTADPALSQMRLLLEFAELYDRGMGTHTADDLRARIQAREDQWKMMYINWRLSASGIQAARDGVGFATGGAFEVGGHGGTDSQMVQFMATPGEHIMIRTPGQRAADEAATSVDPYRMGGRGKAVNIYMTVVTPDAGSFKRSEKQISQSLAGKLSQAFR